MKDFLENLTSTPRKQAPAQNNNNHFQTIFENHTAIMLMIDPENGGRILDANQAACNYYGYPKSMLQTMSLGQITFLPETDDEIEHFGRQSMENDFFHFQHRLASGEIRNVEFHSTSIQIGDQAIIFAIIHDITDRLKTRQQINEFAKELDRLYEQIIERNKEIERDLRMAQNIQNNLIPSKNPENIYSFYEPMDKVGGDFYDFLKFKEKELVGIFISDVSGHGIQAALVTSMLKTLLETSGPNRATPSRLLKFINQKIHGLTNDNFLTAFYGIYNRETKVFKYSRAAHNFPYLIRDNKVSFLESKGKILGFFDDIDVEDKEIQLQSGDTLFLYTDGLTEVHDANKDHFFEEYLPKLLLDNYSLGVKTLIEKIHSSLLRFAKGNNFHDDICMIAMQIP